MIIKLDLTKLLGFRISCSQSSVAKYGVKVGVKVGVKAGAKIGTKPV